MRKKLDTVYVEESLLRYIATSYSRHAPQRLSISVPVHVLLWQCSMLLRQVHYLGGRDFVTPEDVKFVTPSILQHRLILTAEAEMEGYTPLKVAQKLIDKVEVPK